MTVQSTACVIVIGNEILSGRIKDENLPYLGKALAKIGIPVREAHVIPDLTEDIVATVNAARERFTYVFTTGGIGPTHDDITAASIAAAFGVPLVRPPDAERLLGAYYGETLNPARLRMAGVPRIMQAMFDGIAHTLGGGPAVLSRAVTAEAREGNIAEPLAAIQKTRPGVDIGSYPFGLGERIGTCIVGRSTDRADLDAAMDKVTAMFRNLGHAPSDIDPMAAQE